MAKHRPLRVLLYRPPWRNDEPYFRAQQVAAHFRQSGDRVAVIAGPHGWRSLGRLLSWPWHLARADLVFLYPQPLMPFFALTAKLLGRRVVIDHYVSYVQTADASPRASRWLTALDRAAYRRADAVLAHTKSVAKELQITFNLPDTVHTLYCAVDTVHFAPVYDDQAARLRHKLGLNDCFVVLYHGLWHRWHGLETLRAATAQLAEAGEPVALVLIGRAGAGAAHERLLGEVAYTNLPTYIQIADAWCSGFTNLPRGDHSFSSTMIQAMAMARPVITSSSPEKAAWLRDGINTILVPPDNPKALAAAIRQCRKDAAKAQRIGEEGRRLVEKEFDVKVLHQWIERYVESWFGRQAE